MFCALFLKIALSAAELMSFGHLGAAVSHRWTIICGVSSKYKCYADNSETIDALKDNIWAAIGEIQLHIINNVLSYCIASLGGHLNEIILHYSPVGLYFQIEKEI